MAEADKPAELRAALHGRSRSEVLRLLAELTDSDRKVARKEVLPWVLEHVRDWRAFLDPNTQWSRPDEHRRLREKLGGVLRNSATDCRCFDNFRLAVVACGTRADVERVVFSTRMQVGFWDYKLPPSDHFHYLAGMELLRRTEEWRDEMLLRMVDFHPQDFWTGTQAAYRLGLDLWRLRALPEAELLARMSRQARRLGLIPSERFSWDEVGLRVVRAALEDREEPLLASIDFNGQLIQLLVTAGSEGKLDRADLIGVSLRRLAESSRPHDANWWGRFLEALALTDAEWAERADPVLDLVGAPNARAVGVGLAALTKLLRKKAVEPALVVPVLALAVGGAAAGSAKTAVTLLRRCAEQDPDLRLEALTAALAALHHPKPAVPDVLRQWLESETWWREDPEALYQVAEAAVHAPAAVAVQLDPLLAQHEALSRAPAASAAAASTPRDDTAAADLRRELEERADPWGRALLAALDGGPLPAWEPDLGPRWRDSPPFPVPTSAEEAAHILLRVTAGALSLEDWERLAVGVRLPLTEAERAMLPRLLDPVLRLREIVLETDSRGRLIDWNSAYGALWLAEAWIGRPTAPLPKELTWARTWLRGAARARVASMVSALRRGDTQPPLGTPTHQSGWLDPLVFAQRLEARRDLPEEELWELTAALYRLAPDSEARAAAWRRLQPILPRLEQPAALMVAAALAEGDAGERAQVDLVNWYRAAAGGVTRQVQARTRDAIGWARSIFGLQAPPPEMEVRELVVEPMKVRQLTAPLRCRYGMGSVAVLELVRGQLPRPYRSLLDRKTAARLTQNWMDNANEWLLPGGFLPELAALASTVWQVSPSYAFEFPPVGPELARLILDQDQFFTWSVTPADGVALLRKPEAPVRPFLPLLIRALHFTTEQAGVIVDLLATALRDGRLRLTDLVETLAPALADKKQKPRAILAAVELLVRQYAPARDAAVVTAERVLADHGDGMNAGDRVRLLELLLQWHSEGGSAPAPGPCRSALEVLAGRGKSTRAGALSRQLMDLRGSVERPVQTLRAHDIRTMVTAS